MSPISVTTWNTTTIDGKQYLVIETAQFRVPLDFDPTSNVFIAVAAPTGGLGNFPALVKGDPGKHAEFDDQITLTALEYDDPTPDSANWVTITPGDDDTSPVYRLELSLHKGAPGTDGTTAIDISTVGGTAAAGRTLVVNSTVDGFDFAPMKVGNLYVPASLGSTSAGNPNSTLGGVGLGPFDFPWRPIVHAHTIVTPTGANVRVDMIARLNGESGGNDVGRCFGIAGATERLVMTAAPPPGSADGYNKVAAGDEATVHLRVERQSGDQTFTTSASTTRFGVEVLPV